MRRSVTFAAGKSGYDGLCGGWVGGVAGPAPWGTGDGNFPERGHARTICAAGGAKLHDSDPCGGLRGRCVSSRSGGATVCGREEAAATPPLRAARWAIWISGVGGTEINSQSSTLPIGAGITARSSDPRTGKKRVSGGVLQRDLKSFWVKPSKRPIPSQTNNWGD